MKTTTIFFLGLTVVGAPLALAAGDNVTMSGNAKIVPHNPKVFRPDPSYREQAYDYQAQLKIYGDKQPFPTPRPLIELGGKMYSTGLFREPSYIFGRKNPMHGQFLVFGDIRTTAAAFETATSNQAEIAAQLTLDFDWRLTSTERLHAIMRPLQKDGRLTRVEFNKDLQGNRNSENFDETDPELDAGFFEGDLGNIWAGMRGRHSGFDLPFAFGLMPILFQNGVWMDDAIGGIAFSIPAMHSTMLDISNMDLTFFAGIDKVNSAITVAEEDISIYGVTAFIEANKGYWELGYGFTQDNSDPLPDQDQSYHNVTIAFTKRYEPWFSNSIRLIGNFGQDATTKTADGFLLIVENSMITRLPSTFIPYFNFWYAQDRPQSLARDGAAGGILKNIGLTFESGGLSAIPSMDAGANDTAGIALGMEYLFALNQQLVAEVAYLSKLQDTADVGGDQIGFGLRFQRALSKAWIVRLDFNAIQTDLGTDDDLLTGVGLELRRKF